MTTELTARRAIRRIVNEHLVSDTHLTYTELDATNKMILPFFYAFGWSQKDVYANVHVPNAHHGHAGYVDLTLRVDGEDQIAIEAKRPSVGDLSPFIDQLADYFNNTSAHIGILTNGIEYWFFSWAEDGAYMDNRPFARINIRHLDISRRDNFIMRLRRRKFEIRLMKWFSHADFTRKNIYGLLGKDAGGNNSTLAFENFKTVFRRYKLDGQTLDYEYMKEMFDFTIYHSRYNYSNDISEW